MRRTIREMTEQLMGLGDEAWGHYAFSTSPWSGNFQRAESQLYKACYEVRTRGRSTFKDSQSTKTVLEITRRYGNPVETPDIPNGGGHVTFAQYEETGKIIIFHGLYKKG